VRPTLGHQPFDTDVSEQEVLREEPTTSLALTVVVLATMGIAGQSQSSSIQGAWRAVEVTLTGPGARTITNPGATPDCRQWKALRRVEEQSERSAPGSGRRFEGKCRRTARGLGSIRWRGRFL
jgi:hypothetical protein